MTSLLMNGVDGLVDDVAAAQTAEMAMAVERALGEAFPAELLDHEIAELVAVVTAELVATYLTVTGHQGTTAAQPQPSSSSPQSQQTHAHPNEGVHQ